MFGKRPHREENQLEDPQEDPLITEFGASKDEINSNIPYWELMEKIDQILTTLSSFKPYISKVGPFIEKFLNKK